MLANEVTTESERIQLAVALADAAVDYQFSPIANLADPVLTRFDELVEAWQRVRGFRPPR